MTNLEWWRAHRPKELSAFVEGFDCNACPCFSGTFCLGDDVHGCIDALAKWARAEHAGEES